MDLFGFRVKLPPISTSLTRTTQRKGSSLSALPKNRVNEGIEPRSTHY